MKGRKGILFLLIFLTLGGLYYSNDLLQVNRETLFLTNSGIQQYREFKKRVSERKIIVLKKDLSIKSLQREKEQFRLNTQLLKSFCGDRCSIISGSDLTLKRQNLVQLEGDTYSGLILLASKSFSQVLLKEVMGSSYWSLPKGSLHIAGVSYTNFLLNQYSKSIKEKLFPALFVTVFLCLCLIFKSLRHGVILFFPSLMASSFSLSLIKTSYEASNLITAIVPLLMFVINLSLTLHIYYTFIKLGDIKNTFLEKKTPILLMIATTFIGFFSLYFSSIEAISDFGLLASFSILFTSLFSLAWISSAFQFLAKKDQSKSESEWSISFDRHLSSFFKSFYSKRSIIGSSLIFLIIGLVLFPNIPVLTDATQYFPKRSGIKASIDNVSRSIIGTPIVELFIPKKEELSIDDLKRYEVFEFRLLKKVKKINTEIKLISANKITQVINLDYSENKMIPNHKVSYLTLFSKAPDDFRKGYSLEKGYRISLFSTPMNVSEYEKIIALIENVAKSYKINLEYNGLYFQLMVAQKKMIHTLFKSFIISLILIASIAFLAFRKTRVFFIFFFVNLIPVTISFIFLKFFGLSFNIATVMTYSISLGLIVDSSFHIIHSLEKKDLSEEYFYQTLVKPVFFSSVILSGCFLMFGFNDFLPIREFGICLSIIIFIGMIFDLKVLPTIFLNRTTISKNSKLPYLNGEKSS